MNIEQAAEKLNQFQIEHAGVLSRMANSLEAGGETGVLLWISRQQNEVFAIDVIRHFDLTPGRVANIIKKLEEKGYIERRQNTEDLRKSFIRITETGKQQSDRIYMQMNEKHIQILAALGEEDCSQTMRILHRLISLYENGTEIAPLK